MMKAQTRTNPELIKENTLLKQRIQELDKSEADRKSMEEALRISENMYRTIFETSTAPLAVLEEDYTIAMINDAFEKVAGYSREETVGTKWTQYIVKEDVERMVEYNRNRIQDRSPVPSQYTFRYIHKSGEFRHAYLSTAFIPGTKRALVSCLDITDLKKAENSLRENEARYRVIIENMLDVYYKSDREGNAIMISPSGVKLLGYDSEDEFLGKSIANHAYFVPEERDRMISILREKGSVTDYEVTLRNKEGHPVPVSTSSRYYYDEKGEVLGVEGIFRDIRERKRAEDEKRSLEERLNRAEKMEALGLLAGGVAHDLNNVLGVIVGYSDLILHKTDESSPTRPHVINIMKGGERAAAIVNDLLTLTRRGVSGRDVLNLNKIIADCQQLPEFERLSSYHCAVQIKTDLEPDLLNISGSSVHLCKTLFNLVSNASEAMPKGGVVTIRTANQYLDKPIQGYEQIREGDYVVLSVSDTGEGISAADLKRIFEPFYTKKVMGRSGTGLGLTVVWGTVKDHNGYINVQSGEDIGSVVTLYFPVTREDLSAEAAAISISEYMGSGESILVVDDIEAQRDLAADILRQLDYSVASVSSGEEAIAYLKDHHVDLMVLDMIMDPGMDGMDTYKNVLEIHPKQKAIIVSGFSESDRVKAAQALGVGAYVRKPYIIEKLGLAVRKELDRST